MGFIQWTEELSIGIGSVDDQHKTLVAILNSLHDGMIDRTADEHLSRLLAELTEYTVEHFAYEESLMDKFDYDDTDLHKLEHKRLVKDVENFNRRFNDGHLGLSMDLMQYLRDWLNNHILEADKKLGKFLKGKV